MSQNWFTGGLALNQFNIIEYCNRPFKTVDQMNDALLENLNRCVDVNDTLHILGNYVFAPLNQEAAIKTVKYFRERINCRNVFLCVGNQDSRFINDSRFRSLFKKCEAYYEYITDSGISCIMFHYPLRNTWNRKDSGSYQLYAHSHGKENFQNRSRQIDVSVDSIYLLRGEYRPINEMELKVLGEENTK